VSPTPRASDLAAALHGWARQYGDRPAVVGEGGGLSFAALDRAADAWARTLRAGGGPSTHVGLLAGNSPQWLAVAFGAWRAGATLVPISTFVTARELGEIIEHADVETLVVQPRLRSHDYRALLAELPSDVRPSQIIDLGDGSFGPLEGGSPSIGAREIDPESIACILYTSGTTGRAKGVMLSHRAILATVLPTSQRTGLAPDDSLLSTLPLFWVAGLVIRALPTLATGCTLLVLESFTPDAVLAALRRHRPTALHLRPPQIGQILSHPGFEPELLGRVRKGGGRAEWFQPHLDPAATGMITGYGMTETAGYVTALDWRDPPQVRATQIGRPLPGVELRIVDGEGGACPAGESGEVRIRAPGLFTGYYKQPPGTGLDDAGFFCSGDFGCIDAAGVFHFSGRSKDLLRVKGINVSPAEVESVLATHPAVDSVYVVGLPADGLEQEIVAVVVTRADAPLPEAELRTVAAKELSHYKCPARYVQIRHADVPLSGTAKPQRAALAELARNS
jgi:acyl-CoA synthetase (AMP-forming)/AMP-acid ligase II